MTRKPKHINGSPVASEHLTKLRAEAMARQQQYAAQLQQLQATANQLVGQLNQVAGEIKAIDAMMGGN